MIYTGFYYLAPRLFNGEYLVAGNDGEKLFQPGKYFETFPVWLEYIRKNYPEEHIIIFNDIASPVPISEAARSFEEAFEFIDGYTINPMVKIHIKNLTTFADSGYRAMQRNLVEAIIFAYKNNDRLLWVDNDCFLNENLFSEAGDAEVFAANIAHFQFTMDSYCFYVSAQRLHVFDGTFDLPAYLTNILNDAPHLFRIHGIHEGGLYKLFCYGNTKSSQNINMCHRPCYNNFVQFLYKNPLISKSRNRLLDALILLDKSALEGVKIEFQDSCYERV